MEVTLKLFKKWPTASGLIEKIASKHPCENIARTHPSIYGIHLNDKLNMNLVTKVSNKGNSMNGEKIKNHFRHFEIKSNAPILKSNANVNKRKLCTAFAIIRVTKCFCSIWFAFDIAFLVDFQSPTTALKFRQD